MKVLILASPDDSHAVAVSKHLTAMNAHVDFLRFEEFVQKCSVQFTLGTGERKCSIVRDSGKLDLYSYSSVWRRRPGGIRSNPFVEPWIAKMVEQEAQAALGGIFDSMNCLWMNHPVNDMRALDKLWQLQIAEKIGLRIPETLVTNEPHAVKAFFEQCNGEVIYKLISEISLASHAQK